MDLNCPEHSTLCIMSAMIRSIARWVRHIIAGCLKPPKEAPIEDDDVSIVAAQGQMTEAEDTPAIAAPNFCEMPPPAPSRKGCPISLVPLDSKVTTIECNGAYYSIVPFATYLVMSHPAWLCPLEHRDVEKDVVEEMDSVFGGMQQAIEDKGGALTEEETVLLSIPKLMPLYEHRLDKEQQEEAIKSRERKGTIRSLTTIMDNLISEIYDTLEKDAQGAEESKTESDYDTDIITLMSEFNSVFDQLLAEDQEMAHNCLQGYIVFLQGPKRRPTKDPHTRLPHLISLLEGCLSIEQRNAVHEGRRRLVSADL